MEKLFQSHCVPCEGGIPPMTQAECKPLLVQVPGWTLAHNALERAFKFKNFAEAVKFVNRVAELAEAEGHHPDIRINYNRVTLSLTTHAIKGLSKNDFILAAKINELL